MVLTTSEKGGTNVVRLTLSQILLIGTVCLFSSYRLGMITYYVYRHKHEGIEQFYDHTYLWNASNNNKQSCSFADINNIYYSKDIAYSRRRKHRSTSSSFAQYSNRSTCPSIGDACTAMSSLTLIGSLTLINNDDGDDVPILEQQQQQHRNHQIKVYHNIQTDQNILYFDDHMIEAYNENSNNSTAVFYEAMVHPSMIIHPYSLSLQILIINDFSGNILREVLKYRTVQKVFYVYPNDAVIPFLEHHIQDWGICRGCNDSDVSCKCRSDPRVEIIYTEDFVNYINNTDTCDNNDSNYIKNESVTLISNGSINVVFMDSYTYPNVMDKSTIQAITDKLLADCGILTCHTGKAETWEDLPSILYPKNTSQFKRNFGSVYIGVLEHSTSNQSFGTSSSSFHSIVDYSEQQSKFVIAMKCEECRSNWLWNEAEVQVEFLKRIGVHQKLSFFDSATMMQYQFTSRIVEEIWCRTQQLLQLKGNTNADYTGDNNQDIAWKCGNGHGYDPDKVHVPVASFEVKPSLVANGGRGVYAKHNIRKGSMIMIDECVNGIVFPMDTVNLLWEAADTMENISDFWNVISNNFLGGYGWDHINVLYTAGVDSSISTFVNHGCNGTYNVGSAYKYTETNISECNTKPDDLCMTCDEDDFMNDIYNPYHARIYPLWLCNDNIAIRDIQAGEEMLDNYLCYGGNIHLLQVVEELQYVCSGGVGTISQYDKRGVES